MRKFIPKFRLLITSNKKDVNRQFAQNFNLNTFVIQHSPLCQIVNKIRAGNSSEISIVH